MDALVRLLIVDDEREQVEALARTLRVKGFATTGTSSAAQAIELLRSGAASGAPFDVLITDLTMPGIDGIELARAAQEIDADIVSILMTGHGSIGTAVEAMKSGALDYILKPFNLDVIVPAVSRAAAVRRLRLENAALQKSVAERTADLEAANAELRAANRELEAFTATVSHDLRQPLSALAGYGDLLLAGGAGELNALQSEYLGEMLTAARRLFALTEDLLRLARLGQHPLRKEPVDVAAMVASIVADLRAGEPVREIEVRVGDLPAAHADAALLRQVLANLLGNAFKFTRQTPRALVEVTGWSEAGSVVYAVRDNGAGFSMGEVDEMFRIFRRLHGAESFEGTGVGLSIVQRIVERHGGEVHAEGEPGRGARFTFRLPREPRPPLA